ncbi:GDSL-type esterase/lipase family protein [Delftia acidovorans]
MDWLQKLLCRLFGYRCPLSIELNGDSILNGYGVDITPVQRIQAARPWWTLDDRCINGLRLQKLMLTFADVPHNSRVTVVALGANDGFGLVPPDEYRADLLEAVRISRECGSTPVFTGLPGMPLGRFPVEWTDNLDALNAVMHDIATQQGIPHAGWDADFRGDEDLNPDGVHRTQAASDRLAQLLIQTIDRLPR